MDRRAFLRWSALGAALPLGVACKTGKSPRHFDVPGRLVNPSPVAGHLLRTPVQALPPPTGPLYDAVIVGGGLSGLAAAWRLRRAGLERFLLLELEDELGGTARAGAGAGTAFPWGAHYINIPPAEADCIHAVLQDLGIIEGYDAAGRPQVDPRHLLRWPHERLFCGGRWVEELNPLVDAGAAEWEDLQAFEDQMLRWTLHRGRDGRRAFAMPLLYSTEDRAVRQLDQMSMVQYLRQEGWDRPALRWLVDYACRDDYGSLAQHTSAWAGIHYFACRAYDRRLQDQYPSDTLTWPEGNAYLSRSLAAKLDVGQYRTGSLVRRIASCGEVQQIAWADVAQKQWHMLRSRTVVYAGKLHTAPYVVDGLPQRQVAAMRRLAYSPWLVAAITVRQMPSGAGVGAAWDNVLYDSPSLGYIVADHQKARPDEGRVLVYYLPFVEDIGAARQNLLDQSHAYWVDYIMNDLLVAHPALEEVVERIDIYRWGHAMVRPAPGQLWGEDGPWRRQAHGAVSFATCDATGLPLFEEACFTGIWAAEQCLARLGVTAPSLLGGLPRV